MNSQEIDEILQHLENAKYIGASKAVQIIHQLNKERLRLHQRVLDLENKLDWLSEKGYESHPITGNEPTYEDRMKKPKRKMIDPPSGWRYGFPKEIPEHVDNTRQWLLDNGYPQSEIDACGDSFFVRGWYE